MAMDKISIIMPVRNALPYLEDCIESILSQSYSNWELIAVNDHSSDQSTDMLQKHSSQDNRIHLLHNPGHGIIDALSYGYVHATGNLFTRMDADDLMPSIKLEELKSTLEHKGKMHVSTGKVKYICDGELGLGFQKYELWLNHLCDTNSHYKEIYKECVIPSPCWMMYRSDFEAIGGFNSAQYPEDYDLCFRMYANQIQVAPSLKTLHIWRDHSERASRNDDNYTDNRFLDIKIKYFLAVDHKPNERLVLWGAGKKGKRIAQILQENNVEFDWVTDNEKKIGKSIYSKKLENSKYLLSFSETNCCILIAVANEDDQSDINDYINKHLNLYKKYTLC
jgi:glycosyltransferase involved in cell wall biosynthesis